MIDSVFRRTAARDEGRIRACDPLLLSAKRDMLLREYGKGIGAGVRQKQTKETLEQRRSRFSAYAKEGRIRAERTQGNAKGACASEQSRHKSRLLQSIEVDKV
ncbi:hypothetical protein TRVL_07778 [Trypanosoma vivax]|nr:hypothetical protein TRVL_07778 [Trypanosoma vivax]